jgi:hypothetical protein
MRAEELLIRYLNVELIEYKAIVSKATFDAIKGLEFTGEKGAKRRKKGKSIKKRKSDNQH